MRTMEQKEEEDRIVEARMAKSFSTRTTHDVNIPIFERVWNKSDLPEPNHTVSTEINEAWKTVPEKFKLLDLLKILIKAMEKKDPDICETKSSTYAVLQEFAGHGSWYSI